MNYKAVIFDLYGTLVANFSMKEHEAVVTKMAKIVSAPPDDFVRLWFDSYDWRAVGRISTPEDNIRYICGKLGIAPKENGIQEAARERYEFIRRGLEPDPEALPVILKLKSMGYMVGLISDCSAETPASWGTSPLSRVMDTAIFSCLAGFKKPEPRIYLQAAEQLGVRPEDCLYVGDGASHELSGAASVGMYPVMIRPREEGPDDHPPQDEQWHGRMIVSLNEVLELLGTERTDQTSDSDGRPDQGSGSHGLDVRVSGHYSRKVRHDHRQI